MKPVGLTDPRTGRFPYAAVQLRQDTLAGDHYSLVGLPDAVEVGRAGARAEDDSRASSRPSSCASAWCTATPTSTARRCCATRGRRGTRDDLFFAGQVSGVEGYVESAASGLIAGRNAAALVLGRAAAARRRGRRPSARWRTTCRTPIPSNYQPTNITHGIMQPLDNPPRDKMQKKMLIAERALADLEAWQRTADGRSARRPATRAMKEHLKAFLAYLRYNRNVSPHTVRAYDSDITQYLSFVGSRAARDASAS